jgi:hypothetical protein
VIEGIDAPFVTTDAGSDRDKRPTKPCAARMRSLDTKRPHWCLLPDGHEGDHRGVCENELPEAFEGLEPGRKPRWSP